MRALEELLELCRSNGWRVATAESCTGGLLAAALTETPGSSDVFDRGFVTYSNSAKVQLLDVDEQVLADHGAVSREVAVGMACGALAKSRADFAASITGIAGPGGSEFKPEGLVCFCIAGPNDVIVAREINFGAIGRAGVRAGSVDRALELLLKVVQNQDQP